MAMNRAERSHNLGTWWLNCQDVPPHGAVVVSVWRQREDKMRPAPSWTQDRMAAAARCSCTGYGLRVQMFLPGSGAVLDSDGMRPFG
jgi:hypothetical protein